MATATVKPKAASVNWHVITSNLVLTVIGLLGYFQPGFPSNSTLVQAVVPSVAAAAIATLTAVFSHSPSATLSQIQTVATKVAADQSNPEIKEALTSLATALVTLNTNISKTTTTVVGENK